MSDRYFRLGGREERGLHQAFVQPIAGEHAFRLYAGAATPAGQLEEYKRITTRLQRCVAEARKAGTQLRARGALWSLSAAAVTPGHLIETKALRMIFRLPKSQVSSSYAGESQHLRFVECGASIRALNVELFKDRLSLPASGANDGQTIAGAISTGTHGSAFKTGSVHDAVVGLHLITAADRSVYLERATYPVVRPGFAAQLGAELIQDDDLFNAALVSFGCMGVIHGLMVEAQPLFVLDAFRFWRPFDAALKAAITTLDLDGLEVPSVAGKKRGKPYHFELLFNPNEGTPPDEACVTLMFESPYTDDYQQPQYDPDEPGPGQSALHVMGSLLALLPDVLARPILNAQVRDRFVPTTKKKPVRAVVRDLFRGEPVKGKTLSTAMGVRLEDALPALSVAFKVYKSTQEVLPILLSMRFVKASPALLGLAPFAPATCMLEVDSINIAATRKYLDRLWTALRQAGITFTVHWGKFNDCLEPALVRSIYGERFERWKRARRALLRDEALGDVFSNPFSARVGVEWPDEVEP